MTRSYPEFGIQLVPVLLDMMGERVEDPEWIYSKDFDDDDHESSAVIAEGAIDRLSQTLGQCYSKIHSFLLTRLDQ